MNEKDKYIEARDNSIAKLYLEFDLCKNNNPNAFFAFFEGKDAPYYSMRIERISNKEVEPIKCKGKSNVKGIYKYLSKKNVHIPADTRSAFPVISVQSPVSIQCCWQS